ncbi:MAG: hypothetical protein IKV57_00710 [Clostridia bacterium]|nr:hypothetical protein [Clostridia bacterium]
MFDTIDFAPERYDVIRETYRKWWGGSLGRPAAAVVTYGNPARRPASPYPHLSFDNSWDMSITPEQFIDAADYRLSTMRWYGEAFPNFSLTEFGPGVLAALLGCKPVNGSDTVWFMPPEEDIPIEDLHFTFDENNPCFQRVLRMYELAMEKWHGQVVVGMVDMGGVLDVLSSFRGAENLLMDLYDAPEEVLRCVKEIQELWFKYYDRFNSVMAPEAKGYTQWYNLYDEKPGYILQSDFSYMIGPDMFDTFVAPELADSSARMHNAVYHMDGIGQIPHLNSLLAIDGIKGIQWVHGDGTPAKEDWSELLEKILASGKKLLSCCLMPDWTLNPVIKDPGQAFLREMSFHASQTEDLKRYCGIHGIALD